MEYKTISIEYSDKIIIVKLNRSVTNALNLAWGILHSGNYRKPVVFHHSVYKGNNSYE